METSNFDSFVTDETKRLWRYEVDLAKDLIDVCERHGLKLFACYGTLLGAVRHKGFIPWDDDMDFVMMREDYDKLCQLSAEEFKQPFRLVNSMHLMRLINPETTFIQTKFSKLDPNICQGVWIDIFCIDAVPNDKKQFYRLFKKVQLKRRMVANKRNMCFASGTVITKLFHLFCCCFFSFVDINRFNERIHESQRRNNIANNETVIEYGANSLLLKSSKLKFYDKHCFDSVIYLPFEDIQLPCPIGFDSILRLKYGDYMIPVKAKTNHGDVYINLDRPYREIINERLASIPWYKRFTYRY